MTLALLCNNTKVEVEYEYDADGTRSSELTKYNAQGQQTYHETNDGDGTRIVTSTLNGQQLTFNYEQNMFYKVANSGLQSDRVVVNDNAKMRKVG